MKLTKVKLIQAIKPGLEKLGYLYLKKEWKRMLDLVKIGLDSLNVEK